MKNKLKKLFDYQLFEQNKQLQDIINKALDEQTQTVLSDELLGAVAGGKNQEIKSQQEQEKNDH